MKQMFTKNEIAKLLNISYKVLRGYEEKGLITPTYINQDNGYKYYNLDQIYLIDMIRFSNQQLDIPLNEIRPFLGDSLTPQNMIQELQAKRNHAEEMITKYQKIIENIDNSLEHLQTHNDLLIPYYMTMNHVFSYYELIEPVTFLDSKSAVMKICSHMNTTNLQVVVKRCLNNIQTAQKIGIIENEVNENFTTKTENISGEYLCIKFYDYKNNTDTAINKLKEFARSNNIKLIFEESYFIFQELGISTMSFKDFLVELRIKIDR
ncbi:MAG: MerR family transcriptional regulator [Erysipelotrichales bacterium]|nr:MerR family transcriptional regulator [Erysipelotrichales bacterium]